MYSRDHAVEAGSPRIWIRSGATPSAPAGTRRRARRRGGSDGAVTGFQQPPSEPAKTTAARAYRGRDESDVGPAAGCPGGQLGPEVELGEDQEVGLEGPQQAIHVLGQIVRKVVRSIEAIPSASPRQRD